MTKIFCDRCHKDITKESKEIEMVAGVTKATLKKPSVYLGGIKINLIQDICWKCIYGYLNEYLDSQRKGDD